MILSKKDRDLINDYIEIVKEKEEVLWEGTMGAPLSSKDTKSPKPKIGCLSLTFFLALMLMLSGGAIFTPFILIIGLMTHIVINNQPNGNNHKNTKARNTQYLITNKGIVFILWRKGKLHIHNIPYSNIKKIIVNGRDSEQGSIFIIPQEAVSFRTYNYKNNKPSPYISLLNIPHPHEVEAILQNYL